MKKHYTQEQVDRMLDEQASRTTAEMLDKFKGYKSSIQRWFVFMEWQRIENTNRIDYTSFAEP